MAFSIEHYQKKETDTVQNIKNMLTIIHADNETDLHTFFPDANNLFLRINRNE